MGLVRDAKDESVTINDDRTQLEYRFTKNGARYTVVYALKVDEEAAFPVKTLQLVRTSPGCPAMTGPLIDAIEIRRGGHLIPHDRGVAGFRPCDNGPFKELRFEWVGAPDGKGFPLFGQGFVQLEGYHRFEPGDEITVTVLDGHQEPYDLYVASGAGRVKLGSLQGTGTVVVPFPLPLN